MDQKYEKYKDVIKEFIEHCELNLSIIHHAEIINSYPEKYYYVKHRCGDEIHSIFYKIFGFELPWHKPEYYSNTIIGHRYDNKYYKSLLEAESEFSELLNPGKYIWKSSDKNHPVWYANGIHIYDKDKYDNISTVSHMFNINWYNIEECKAIVDYINENYTNK